MKTIKKLKSIIISSCLLTTTVISMFGTSITASAVAPCTPGGETIVKGSTLDITSGTSTGSQTIDTYGYTADAEIVYSVDVEWGRMLFKYQETYNSATYETTGAWESITTYETTDTFVNNEIKISNNSNANMTANFSYAPVSTTVGADGAFYNSAELTTPLPNDEINLTMPVEGGTAITGSAFFMPTNAPLSTLGSDESNFTKLGEITVSIEPTV